MSKKIITSCIKLLCVILICTIFTGCAAKNTNNINIDDQPYWNVFNHYITKGENGYYFISHNYLYFMQDNGKGIILCNNASCIHDSEECLAYLSINYNSQQLYYYNNKLYVMYNDFKESNSCYLIEIAADGSERKRLFEIGEASVKYGLTFHDNCVYIYTRQGGVSGFKQNTATIRARSLDGKKDKIIHSYTGMGATIYALKKGCEKFGVPRSIYTDNGREFLFHDLGGNGFRKKKKNGEELKLPSILDDLGIEFRTALPRNARGKGIERAFCTVKEQFSKLFESYTGGTILERPDRLKRIVKTMKGLPNIEELIQYVDIYIEGWYNKQSHEGAGMRGKCPDEIFAENLITQRILPKEKEELMFMRYAKSNTGMLKVGKNGVTLTFYGKQLQYWNEELWLGYFGQNVYVRYNPEDLSSVRIYDNQKRFLCIAVLKEELSYTASKQEVKKQQQQNRNAIKRVANYQAKKEMEQKDTLTLLLEKAIKNTENEKNNTVRAKIAEPILYSENNIKNNDDLAEVVALPKAVGSEKVDWSKGIERLKKWKEENENIVF